MSKIERVSFIIILFSIMRFLQLYKVDNLIIIFKSKKQCRILLLQLNYFKLFSEKIKRSNLGLNSFSVQRVAYKS